MKWNVKKFNQLDINTLYSILKLRSEVFVLEQNCPYQDIDEKDQKALHIFSLDENNKYDFKQNLINNDNSSFKYIINNSHPNFFLISNNLENSNSQISKVRELINFTNKSSFNNSFKIIIIDNVELMNTSSVNALLKLVEQPN